MSRRTAEANKAIRLAWEREQALVSEGKGTRDWTKEQQQDILDPDKGKAYDDKGRAFEGQHMKSVAEYPEYQGNPDNIQFLTKDEHLEAHKGSWQNPTNWYFNPDTKEFVDFGEGEPVQCKIIDLNDPISITSKATIEAPKSDTKENEISEPKNNSPPKNNSASDSDKINIKQSDTKEKVSPQIVKKAVKGKTENGFIKGLKTVGKFFVSHPVESLEIAAVVVGGVVEVLPQLEEIVAVATRYTVRVIIQVVQLQKAPVLLQRSLILWKRQTEPLHMRMMCLRTGSDIIQRLELYGEIRILTTEVETVDI